MGMNTCARLMVLGGVFGALACASNSANDTEQSAAAPRDSAVTDTMAGNSAEQNRPGYRGMERDTTATPYGADSTAGRDSVMMQQGIGRDTAGYSGIERVVPDSSANAGQPSDSASMSRTDSSRTSTTAPTQQQPTGDTTGYQHSQQQNDSTSQSDSSSQRDSTSGTSSSTTTPR
jgi:hypothetical protein